MKNCPQCNLSYPSESTFCFIDGATLAATDDFGDSFAGVYRAVEPIGESAWARVYRARYRLSTDPCVLKVWKTRLTEPQKKRFRDALAMSQRFGWMPAVAEVVGGGITEDGLAFAASSPLEGRPLSEELRKGALAEPRLLSIALQILRALARIHDFGGAHGDLRPSNVLLGPGDRTGVVHAALGRTLLRDPWEDSVDAFPAQQFLPPEASPELRSSAAGDLFALGMLLHQMVRRKALVEAADARELRGRLADLTADGTRSALSSAPERLATLVAALCERFPQNRPSTRHALEELTAVAEAAEVPLPPWPPRTATAEDGASSAATPEIDPTFSRWRGYYDTFKKMAQAGFPAGPPPDIKSTLATLGGRLESLDEIGKKGLYHLGSLQDSLARAREGRQRIADQMAELAALAKEVRDDLAPLRLAAGRHGAKAAAFKPQLIELHKELVRWEGRSGFSEPYKELADAYRTMADTVDAWWSVRSAQLACETDAAKKDVELAELDAQVEELRAALRIQESNVAQEIESTTEELGGLGRQADEIEPELVQLATRFSSPLRSKPELGPLFRELQQLPK